MIKVARDGVTRDHVSRAIGEYDRLGPEQFFSQHGFDASQFSIDNPLPPGAALMPRKETRLCAQHFVVSRSSRSCSSY
jgi:hypothetical protein